MAVIRRKESDMFTRFGKHNLKLARSPSVIDMPGPTTEWSPPGICWLVTVACLTGTDKVAGPDAGIGAVGIAAGSWAS